MYQEFTIKLKPANLNLSGIRTGNAQGQTIIALHGWLDNCFSFKPLLPYMQNYNFIALDFAGHGLSDHRSPDSYINFMDYINDLTQALDILSPPNNQKIHLLGHSLGGSIAAFFAALYPERINKLCLIDSLGPMIPSIPEQIDLLRYAGDQYFNLAKKQLKIFATHEEAIQARVSVSPMHKESLQVLISRALKEVSNGYSWRTDPRLMIPSMTISIEHINELLNRITCQSLLILPTDGWKYGSGFFETRQQFVKNLHINKIPGNHHVHMDAPELVSSKITAFFQ